MRSLLIEKFEAKFIPEPMSGCWLWLGCESGRGAYGVFSVNGKEIRAHRYSYQLYTGEIPKGLLVLHRCDNPACVNPNHLFLGTNQDNSDYKVKKGRQARGPKLGEAMRLTGATRGTRNFQNKLSEDDVLKIFVASDSQREVAKQFGVSQRAVAQIKHGLTWSWLTTDKALKQAVPA